MSYCGLLACDIVQSGSRHANMSEAHVACIFSVDTVFQNVGICLPDYMVSQSNKTKCEFYIAFTVHFHLVFSNQQMHKHKLLYSFY
jgi:hypothetical protein